MTWPHRGKVQLASDNTHLADLRTLPMPRADHALLGESRCFRPTERIGNKKRIRLLKKRRFGSGIDIDPVKQANSEHVWEAAVTKPCGFGTRGKPAEKDCNQ